MINKANKIVTYRGGKWQFEIITLLNLANMHTIQILLEIEREREIGK